MPRPDHDQLRRHGDYLAAQDRPTLLNRTLHRGERLRATNADLSEWNGGAVDLRDAILPGADLRGARLRGARLCGADLTDADLTGADLTGADLTGADLTGALLRGTVLDEAVLDGTILESAVLEGTSLDQTDLTGASAGDAVLRDLDLTRCTLTGADLSDSWMLRCELGTSLQQVPRGRTTAWLVARLNGATLVACEVPDPLTAEVLDTAHCIEPVPHDWNGPRDGPTVAPKSSEELVAAMTDWERGRTGSITRIARQLRSAAASDTPVLMSGFRLLGLSAPGVRLTPGSDLSMTDLRHADLRSAELCGIDARSVQLDRASLQDAKLNGADLVGARLRDADLSRADLSGALLHEADLRDADLTGANLDGVDLRRCMIAGAHFHGVDLSSVRLHPHQHKQIRDQLAQDVHLLTATRQPVRARRTRRVPPEHTIPADPGSAADAPRASALDTAPGGAASPSSLPRRPGRRPGRPGLGG